MTTGRTSAVMAARDPDVARMLRVRAGDQAAFAELVAAYQDRLLGVLNHIVGHSGDAEDLAQEVFLRVYRSRASYTPTAKFSTWLFTLANNVALNALRARKRRPPRASGGEAASSGPWPAGQSARSKEPAPGERLSREELAGVVRAALDQLNDRQRVAVVLNKFEGLGYAEIAGVMGLSPQAVKSLLNRAREQLRQALAPYIGDQPDAGGGA